MASWRTTYSWEKFISEEKISLSKEKENLQQERNVPLPGGGLLPHMGYVDPDGLRYKKGIYGFLAVWVRNFVRYQFEPF